MHAVRTAVVIGGGPAGIAAAIALRQIGVTVLVVDCAKPPIDKACGEGLMPDALRALRGLGIDQPLPGGAPIRGIRFVTNVGSFEADFRSGPGVALRRVQLHSWLTSAAEAVGAQFQWGARATVEGGGQVTVNEKRLRFDLIVGADGQNSMVRRCAGLEACWYRSARYGFRRHYQVRPWSEHVEVYWSGSDQIYVAPVGDGEIGAAVLCENPRTRLADALENCPALKARLHRAQPSTRELGALTIFQRLRRVIAPGIALVGDASGSVDSSTGDGMCLAFLQARALAEGVARSNLSLYEREHRRVSRRSRCMSRLFLFAARHETARHLFFRYLHKEPERFDHILGIHMGEKSPRNLIEYELASVLQRVHF